MILHKLLWAPLLVLSLPSPAWAHGSTIDYAIVGDGAGHVRVAALWAEDGHLVDEPVVLFITAQHSGPHPQRIGPRRIKALADRPGIYETNEALSPGRWEILAESIEPAPGHGEAVLQVGTSTGYPKDFPPRAETTHHRRWLALGGLGLAAIVLISLPLIRRSRRTSTDVHNETSTPLD
ncbi:hypothetical protein [Actinomadura rayongensis]|uniref:YtkA-like domain-containing protein n=1 Tax=Actinomadura rayongensis TaxID=1429076 RepID=A0A6I4W2P6_9ACTN|nr:hypothetical protein [Actinomadura rayongensis]MXQ62546.1 hypothetical protein [Actinomadura rayongensis]